MKILLLGSGGREHSLAWKINQSDRCTHLYCAPGNAGLAQIATCLTLNIDSPHDVVEACQRHNIDFVVVGPEAPLVNGVVDALQTAGIAVSGPSRAAAQLEASKKFTKEICTKRGIPTAAYKTFQHVEPALTYLKTQNLPIVIKADGLAAGKGVVIAETLLQAQTAIQNIFANDLEKSEKSVVIEEFMEGEEVSFFVLCDGETAVPLGSAQDHKRVHDGDKGPNTGGMGAYSPAPVFTLTLEKTVIDTIIQPTLDEMSARKIPFKGVLYAGLMLTAQGPKLVEYNVRFGDPECQVLMLRLETDLVDLLYASATRDLANYGSSIAWSDNHAITVVMAAQGYPEKYDKGSEINLGQNIDNTYVFHAGTQKDQETSTLRANGGRVLNVCATGTDLRQAQQRVYQRIDHIHWPEGFYRHDIGWRALV